MEERQQAISDIMLFYGAEMIPISSKVTTIGYDPADGKDESVISELLHDGRSFTFTQTLSRKQSAKLRWCFGIKTKLPRKLKKKFKNNKL